jgi:hypothetical protein
MIYRNEFGYLRQIPDEQFADGLGDYGEVIYDGFGNPLGILPFPAAPAPLAAKLLPKAAAALPGLISTPRAAAPAPPSAGAAVRVQPPLVSVSPRAPVPEPVPAQSVATESSGEVSGAFYGPFGFYG